MDLDFVRIECDIVADIPAQLTAVLYNELWNFEAHFRAACCPFVQKTCALCAERVECPYRIIFAQQLSPDPEIVRLHQKPSLPFSLYINGMAGNTTSCTVGMVIIGSAINFVEFFHSALLRMVEACASVVISPSTYLLHFYTLDYQDARHEISQTASLPESVILFSAQHILQNTVHSDHVRLTLISPLRLLSNGFIAHRFDFAKFFCSQLRRCSSLSAYYGTRELDYDFARLSLDAQNIAVLEDEIHYTQLSWSKRPNRAGLIGHAECSGLVEPMFSFLRFGSYFNAGKGATFGSGFHHIEAL